MCKHMLVKRKASDGSHLPIERFSTSYDDPSTVAALLRKRGHTLVEFLYGALQLLGKLYFDADRDTGQCEPTPEMIEGFRLEVVERMERYMAIIRRHVPGVSYVVAQRHGYCPKKKGFKMSFRTFVSGIAIHHADCKAFIAALDPEAGFWDMLVYTRIEQLMCAINGKKGKGDERILTPLDPSHLDDERILQYVVQHTEPGWFHIDPQDMEEGDGDGGEGSLVVDGDDSIVRLVRCLGRTTSDSRDDWIRVGMILKGLGGDAHYPAWLEFSRISDKFVSESDCAKTWRSLVAVEATTSVVAVAGRLTMGTLRYFAKRDDPAAYQAWRASERARPSEGSNEATTAAGWDCSRVVSAAALAIQADAEAVSDARVEGRRVLFKCDGIERSVDLATLCIEPGRTFLHADQASALSCDSVLLPNTTVPATGWSVSRPCDTVRLNNDGPPRTLLDLDMAGNNVVRAVASFPDTGKTVALKGGQAMLDMLGGIVRSAICRHLEGPLGVPTHVINNIVFNAVFNGNVTVGGGGEDGAAGEFDAMSGALLLHASERRYKKAGGMVYQPVPGCPCAYRPLSTYEAYINVVLKNDAIYRANPRRFDEMMKFLVNYTELDEMPEFRPDRNLLSFSNGVLQIDDLCFTPYVDIDVGDPRVARHHIDAPYTGESNTPLVDVVLDAQFGNDAVGLEVADLLMALFGRLLFPIGSRDRWQVMPYLVGVGGTGKSLLLSIVDALFRKGAVGNLGGKREDIFGMANLVDKEAVFGRDMPAKLSGALSQELMQAMVTGEAMEVPRKRLTAINLDWTAPVIMASNHLPDYVNTGNNVGRRIVIFRFANVVRDPQEDLLDRILGTELPNVVCRVLTAYHAAVERAKAARGFWKVVPARVFEWRGELAAATNRLHEFLDMDDDERGCAIQRVEGRITWALDLEAAFLKCFPNDKFLLDAAVLSTFGYTTSGSKYENVCLSCKQLARGGTGRCCAAYDKNSNRRKKVVIYGMALDASRE